MIHKHLPDKDSMIDYIANMFAEDVQEIQETCQDLRDPAAAYLRLGWALLLAELEPHPDLPQLDIPEIDPDVMARLPDMFLPDEWCQAFDELDESQGQPHYEVEPEDDTLTAFQKMTVQAYDIGLAMDLGMALLRAWLIYHHIQAVDGRLLVATRLLRSIYQCTDHVGVRWDVFWWTAPFWAGLDEMFVIRPAILDPIYHAIEEGIRAIGPELLEHAARPPEHPSESQADGRLDDRAKEENEP